MSVTIKDIAKQAGVSKSTVSRVLSNSGNFSEETAEKVRKVAEDLNYKPNEIAKAMVTRKTSNIAFVIYHKASPVITNPYFTPIISSVIETATKNNYGIFIFSEREITDPFKTIREKKVDGVILASRINEDIVNAFRSQNIPVVLINPFVDVKNTSYVVNDEYTGCYEAMKHLIEKGHRRIGFIQGFWKDRFVNERYLAYKNALKHHKIEYDDELVIHVEDVSLENGKIAAKQFLLLSERPTAIFAGSDLFGIGLMKEFKKNGLSIPDDIAVVGFDDINLASIYEPELTTVRVEKELMGKIAVQQLLDIINSQHSDNLDTAKVKIPTSLIIRNST